MAHSYNLRSRTVASGNLSATAVSGEGVAHSEEALQSEVAHTAFGLNVVILLLLVVLLGCLACAGMGYVVQRGQLYTLMETFMKNRNFTF